MKNKEEFKNFAIGSGLQEIVNRYGSAGAEFIKGYQGYDHELGKAFERGLKKISTYKIGNENSIKQQAGFAAEVHRAARGNAENIINKSSIRFSRSEDFSGFGKNHTVVDIVEHFGDDIVSTSQMKFVTNVEKLLTNIAKGKDGGKHDLSRYLNVDKLELPTEQVEEAKKFCKEQSESLLKQAERAKSDGKLELADKLQKESDNFKKLENKVSDSGLSTEKAIKLRTDPKWETTKDIANVSHKAGIQGAKFGAAIGGGISLITNAISVYSGDKELSDALFDTTKDALTSAGVGYLTAFSGSALKGVLQQSSSQAMRNLSKTGLPAMVVSACLSVGKSLHQYAKGDIELDEFFVEVGATANGMLSSATFSMIGQIAIPIPVLGGLIGGMVGYTITNSFYRDLINSKTDANLAKARREIIEMQCAAAKLLAEKYQQNITALFSQKLIQLDKETERLFTSLNDQSISANEFSHNINKFAEFLGKDLPYKTQEEFDVAMQSTEILIL